MAATETPTCPTDEDLAAFLDGMLAEPERARIIAHLADCESCYEIFAGAAHFMQDDVPVEKEVPVAAYASPRGRLLPFPFNKEGAGVARRWGIPAAAAAAMLVLWVGFTEYRIYFAEIMAPELVASLQAKADLGSHLHRFTTYRGGGDEDAADLQFQKPSFLVGARLVDLQISLRKGPEKEAPDLLQGIGQGIQSAALIGKDEIAQRYLDAAEQLQSGGPDALGKIKAAAPRWEAELKDSPSLDQDFLTFGKWTEAGRIAAEIGSAEHFSRRNRHFLSHISQILEEEQKGRGQASPSQDDYDADAERSEAALAELRAIAAVWDRGDLQAGDYAKLAQHFNTILRSYDI
jgi:Putative zinc-finger